MPGPPDSVADVRQEQDIRELIQAVVRELAPNPEGGGEGDAHLIDELDYHSLALLELAFTLEDEFDLPPIDEETAREIMTIRQVEDHVVEGLRELGRLAT